jgi:P-type conjugative transfer protein TrbJ
MTARQRRRVASPMRAIARAIVLIIALLAAGAPRLAALTVFDPTNHVQNVLQAARALEQITHQLAMLDHMARNIADLGHSALPEIAAALNQITILMQQAEGISFVLHEAEAAWERHYPKHYPPGHAHDALLEDARQRWSHAVDGYRHALRLQAEIATATQIDLANLGDLVTRSDQAIGNLQAAQAGNELMALMIKQQLQQQSLAAAQYRAATLSQARQLIGQEQARRHLQNFLGRPDGDGERR